jgi:hypothetical protein
VSSKNPAAVIKMIDAPKTPGRWRDADYARRLPQARSVSVYDRCEAVYDQGLPRTIRPRPVLEAKALARRGRRRVGATVNLNPM